MTLSTNLDHLVIAAQTLDQGVTYIRETLGIDMPYGGEHPLMGTHNHLMQLGNDVFLEIIATNPNAPSPNRPRWYGLDDPFIAQAIAEKPRLLTWVINTTDLKQSQQSTAFSLGTATAVSRGSLNWLFGVPDDGRLFASGAIPYLIQWQTESHPASRMADLGCRLEKLEVCHPHPTWLRHILKEIDALDFVDIRPLPHTQAGYIQAHIATPSGTKII